MMSKFGLAAMAIAALLTTSAPVTAQTIAGTLVTIPAGHDDDLRLFAPNGSVVKGVDALARMHGADLVVWVAGNQFFAMEDLVRTFVAQHGAASVGVVTLPPGLEFNAIMAGGFRYNGRDFPGLPDVFATIDLAPLRTMHERGLASSYATYMHNELTLMVAKGNPDRITGIDDLGRADVRSSLPNPLTEGIMQFYARPVLQRHGLYAKLTGGRECTACQTAPNVWFTAVHHRETPERIADGRSDVGIVWKTEAIAALKRGAPVEAVALPPADSARDSVSYYIAPLTKARHPELAAAYSAFVAAPAGQAVYIRYGFVGASDAERAARSI